MVRFLLFFVYFLLLDHILLAQSTNKENSIHTAGEIVSFLASDSLKGRGNYKPELQIAAGYIERHFDSIGLLTLPGLDRFINPIDFTMHPDVLYDLEINSQKINVDDYLLLSASFFQPISDFKNYSYKELLSIPSAVEWKQLFTDSLPTVLNLKVNDEFWNDSLITPAGYPVKPMIILKNQQTPNSLKLSLQPSSEQVLMNVIGVLPGKSKAGEVILFSAHYDHVPPGKSRRDSIFNGANDNASGTAALLMLAKHFAKENNNQRTIIFCAFAGEELGLLGSKDLVKKLNTDKIIAHINMDMVGISQYRKKGFLITGSQYGQVFKIFLKNLKESGYKVYGDYDEERNLFRRSDNYPFALKGIPAHTIMTADDSSICYHQECDEIKNVDMENIANTVEAIIQATSTIINGTDTPKRISVN